MKSNYVDSFYEARHQGTVYAARKILAIVLGALPKVNSAIDLGCGVGTWLSVLMEKGVKDVHGLDGPWVDSRFLQIPINCFSHIDFEEGVDIARRYDLAISLEVAEHLPKRTATSFVNTLVDASDYVLFSAAIPFQGGTDHVNEQWPEYWVKLFQDHGYVVLDFIRRMIWIDKRIPVWYRQNILLFVRKEQVCNVRLPSSADIIEALPLSLVHPDAYMTKMYQMSSVMGSWSLLLRAIKHWAKEKLNSTAFKEGD